MWMSLRHGDCGAGPVSFDVVDLLLHSGKLDHSGLVCHEIIDSWPE